MKDRWSGLRWYNNSDGWKKIAPKRAAAREKPVVPGESGMSLTSGGLFCLFIAGNMHLFIHTTFRNLEPDMTSTLNFPVL